MKLSNKILIGFFGLAFIYLTAVFAEVRVRGISIAIDDTNSIAETADISGVAYLVLEDLDKTINVVGSDQPRLEVRSVSGDLLQSIKYSITGDTLTLSAGASVENQRGRISVFVPESGLKGVTVNGAVAVVEGLHQETFHVSQNDGRIWMSDNSIRNIRLKASGRSYLEMSASELDTLSATIEESEVLIFSPVRLLKGSMRNASILRLVEVDEIQFSKDESSRLNLY